MIGLHLSVLQLYGYVEAYMDTYLNTTREWSEKGGPKEILSH